MEQLKSRKVGAVKTVQQRNSATVQQYNSAAVQQCSSLQRLLWEREVVTSEMSDLKPRNCHVRSCAFFRRRCFCLLPPVDAQILSSEKVEAGGGKGVTQDGGRE